MDALAALIRLARRAVDGERHALAALDRRRAALGERIERLRREAARESEAAGQLPGGAMLLARYLAGARERLGALRSEAEALDRERERQLERLAAKRLEARRLERLAERRRTAAERQAARREERAIDDLIGARAARREAP